jgi:hypothetical protein
MNICHFKFETLLNKNDKYPEINSILPYEVMNI